MAAAKTDPYIAVFFMEDHKVIRQMLFSEFEALLDGYAGLSDMADTEVQAVYVVINSQLKVQSLAFFLIYFDDDGRADPSWNIPLEKLLKASGSGPDLGAGPIKLACRSQCSINWHQKELWDPEMTSGKNDFVAIRSAVDENRLRFEKAESELELPVLRSNVSAESFSSASELRLDSPEGFTGMGADDQVRLARQFMDQQLQIRTLESQREKALEDASQKYRVEVQSYKVEIQSLKETCERLKVSNEQLQEKLLQRNQQYMSLQEKITGQSDKVRDLEERLKGAKSAERESLLRQKLEAEAVLLKEQLDRKDIESIYRDEKEEQLLSEVAELQQKLDECVQNSLLNKLKELEVVFVAYHPGAGHVSVPFSDVQRYADNPIGYVAGKCYVTEEVYRGWLDHQENPVCTHIKENGDLCAEPVVKAGNPSDFELGVSNRCKKHRALF
ncbi:MAG: DNA repair ATPase [Hahellaceae bacterium]|nr:DNA repair ATPase [Hahellaceae bacterium]